MVERLSFWALSSAVLVAVVLLLRAALKRRLSARLRYALWLPVLLRLLLPFSVGSVGFSVENALPAAVETVADAPVYYAGYVTPDLAVAEPHPALSEPAQSVQHEMNRELWAAVTFVDRADYAATHAPTLRLEDLVLMLWLGGAVIVTAVLLGNNLRFALRLRRTRQLFPVKQCRLPVYVSGAAETPCLFGLLRPAVYLTPEVAADETAVGHVLAHELTHHRHGDHVWAALRCLCLALHWYDPLVWLAAILSRQDAELACDEGALRRLGASARADYGRTLIALSIDRRGGVLRAATTMTGSKRSLTERVRCIARAPKTAAVALVTALLVAAVAVGCTFTGGEKPVEAERYLFTQGKDVASITLHSQEFDDDELCVDCFADWVLAFTYGEEIEDLSAVPQRLLDLSVIVRFADGTVEQQGYDVTDGDGCSYYVVRPSEPTCPHEDNDAAAPMALTEDEIAQVNEAFYPIIKGENGWSYASPLSCFFTSYYDDITKINLADFLRYFTYYAQEITDQAEFEALMALPECPFGAERMEDMAVPIHKYPAAVIDAALQEYAGVSLDALEDAKQSGDELYYLPEYDAYYNVTSDFAAGTFSCTHGEIDGDIVRLYAGDSKVLTLRREGDRWLIAAHQRVYPAYDAADLFHEDGCYLFAPHTATDREFHEISGMDRDALDANWRQQTPEGFGDLNEFGIFLFEGVPCLYGELGDGNSALAVITDRCTLAQRVQATALLLERCREIVDVPSEMDSILLITAPTGEKLHLSFEACTLDGGSRWAFAGLTVTAFDPAPEPEPVPEPEPTIELGTPTVTQDSAAPALVCLIPDGETCAFDLNGDGTLEQIVFDWDGGPTWSRYADCLLNIDGHQLTEEMGLRIGSKPAYYAIVDLDTSDPWMEIAVPDDGASADYVTWFYRYDGASLIALGLIQGSIGSTYYDGTPEVIVHGDGTITAPWKLNVLQTWWTTTEYGLVEGQLQVLPKEWFIPRSSDKDLYECRSGSNMPFQSEEALVGYTGPEGTGEAIDLPVGTWLRQLSTAENGWAKFDYQIPDGENQDYWYGSNAEIWIQTNNDISFIYHLNLGRILRTNTDLTAHTAVDGDSYTLPAGTYLEPLAVHFSERDWEAIRSDESWIRSDDYAPWVQFREWENGELVYVQFPRGYGGYEAFENGYHAG